MKLLYLECAMGASGDMLMGALASLLDDPQSFVREMNALGLPGVQVRLEPATKCGINGTHMSVTVHGEEEESLDAHEHHHGHEHDPHDHGHFHRASDHDHDHEHDHHHGHGHDGDHEHHHDHDHEHHHHDHNHDHGHHHSHDHHGHGHEHHHGHHHAGLHDIEAIICNLPVSKRVKDDALAVYRLIAQAESEAHGQPVDQIHFHEVGTLDAVADVVGVSLLMERIAPDRVVASPVNTGFGHVHCAHGILPVPAPATASILRGVPTYAGHVEGELCTPTGAALLKHFAGAFEAMPAMATERIGYGMGKKDFPMANCVRAFLGQAQQADVRGAQNADRREAAGHDTAAVGRPRVVELRCNLDDMTPEAVGFATETLLSQGALDVYTAPVYMKKNRPGVLLSCLCNEGDEEKIARLIFRHTTTNGVRLCVQERIVLDTHIEERETPLGTVRVKHAEGYGVSREKVEYDDAARIARERGMALGEVVSNIHKQQ